MPEHDIVKHTEAIYKSLHEPHKNWKQKLSEILVEIGIIVFAITLSLLLERWRENAHERKIEKKFLTGLKTDLQRDIIQLKNDSITYSSVLKGWNYLRTNGINKIPLNMDSLRLYSNTLTNSTDFIPNNSRFEGFKSSGELDVIENDSLQNLILDLYQYKIVSLKSSTSFFTHFKAEQLLSFLSKNIRYKKEGASNIDEIIQMPEMQNYLILGGVSIEIMQRYHGVITESLQIINMINNQYN